MITIALGIVLAVIILALLPLIGGVLVWLLGIAAMILAFYLFYESVSTMGIYIFIPILVIVAYLSLGLLYSITLESVNSFYNFKLFTKFLFVKFFTPGFTDKQKIHKTKKIGELIKFSDNKNAEAEKQRIEKYFLDFQDSFNKLIKLVNIELMEYLKNEYIDLDIHSPNRGNIKGRILINSNKKKSIIKIAFVSTYSYRQEKNITEYIVGKDSKFIPPFEPSHRDVETWRYLNSSYHSSPRKALRKVKKHLLNYYKLNPELLKN